MKIPTTLVAIRDYLEAVKGGIYQYPAEYDTQLYDNLDQAYDLVEEAIYLIKSSMK